MKKKTIALSITLFVLMLGIPMSGFAFWYFNTKNESNSVSNNAHIDNIYENTSFGKNEEKNKTYTIYFFPSTIYLKQYHDYLTNTNDGTTTVTTTNGNIALPEEMFNASGDNTKPNAVTISKDGTVGYTNDDGNSQQLSSSQTGLGKQADNYVNYIADRYNTSNHLSDDSILRSDSIENGKKTISTLHNDYEGFKSSNNSQTFGNATSDFDSDTFYKNNNGSTNDTYSKVNGDNGYTTNYNYSYVYEDDRFGYWKYKNTKNGIDYSLGRYAPIKIEVTNFLSDEYFSLIPTPFNSMSDEYNFFNLVFSNWTYLTKSAPNCFEDRYELNSSLYNAGGNSGNNTYNIKGSKFADANYLLDPFRSVNCSNLFDSTNDLSLYADENNVIRLFPIFSNGKCYTNASTVNLKYNSSSYDNYTADPTLSRSGLAAAALKYTDSNNGKASISSGVSGTSSMTRNTFQYFAYNGDAAFLKTKYSDAYSDANDNAFSWVYYSSVKNFLWDSNISNLTFTAAGNQLENNTNKILGAYNNWHTNSEINSFFNDTHNTYDDGLYNFYFFYTDERIASLSLTTYLNDTNKANYTGFISTTDLIHTTNAVFNAGYHSRFYSAEDSKKSVSFKQEYNFAYRLNTSNIDNNGQNMSMNYLLQNSNDSQSYYKCSDSDDLSRANSNNAFDTLQNNDLIFMSASTGNNTHTYYGNLSSDRPSGNGDEGSRSNQESYDARRQQIVVAIEKVNEPRFVQGTIDQSKWYSYPLLYVTDKTSYKQSDTSDTSSFGVKLDPGRTFLLTNVHITTITEPLSIYITRNIPITNSQAVLNPTGKIYYNVETTETPTTISKNKVFSSGDTYFKASSNNYQYVAKEVGTYDFFFYANKNGKYEIYAYKYPDLQVRIYSNKDFMQNLSEYNFMNFYGYDTTKEVNNGLIWEKSIGVSGQEINRSTTSDISSSESSTYANKTIYNAIKTYADSQNYAGNYLLYDYSTNLTVGFFDYNKGFIFLTNTDSSMNTFSVIKSHAFYLEETSMTWNGSF